MFCERLYISYFWIEISNKSARSMGSITFSPQIRTFPGVGGGYPLPSPPPSPVPPPPPPQLRKTHILKMYIFLLIIFG